MKKVELLIQCSNCTGVCSRSQKQIKSCMDYFGLIRVENPPYDVKCEDWQDVSGYNL